MPSEDYLYNTQENSNLGKVENMPKYKIVMKYSHGTNLEDDIFDTEEYANYLVGCSRDGAETLNLSNQGDYPLDDH